MFPEGERTTGTLHRLGWRRREGGMGLVAAIFLVVVVTVLVTAILRTVRTGGDSFAQDVVTHRAFLAAESGAELGLNRIFAPVGTGFCGTWTWDLEPLGLARCEARVSCRAEIVQAIPHYTLESDGRCAAGEFVAERRVLVRAVP